MRYFNRGFSGTLLVLAAQVASAGTIDRIGPTYPIREPDMLVWIEKRVADKVTSGEVLRYQQEQADRIASRMNNPLPLNSVSKASRSRIHFHDPSFTVEENIVDQEGKLIVAAGSVINPLDSVALSRPLVFFDARDKEQVAFAKKYLDSRAGLGKPVLVAGSYFDLMKRWQTPVYFDQQGALVRKLGIRHVPAIVIQEGKRLRIDEIAL